mgnify:CR=1 FL=1
MTLFVPQLVTKIRGFLQQNNACLMFGRLYEGYKVGRLYIPTVLPCTLYDDNHSKYLGCRK